MQISKESELDNEMNQEIFSLTDKVSDLHELFKQMQEMVFEQGQIVDRIDYNVDQALIRVEKGNKELVQV